MKVVKASYLDGYRLQIFFKNGKMSTVDLRRFLEERPHPQYNKYRDIKLFKKFRIENGNVVWGKNWDLIFPVAQLYEGRIQS